MDKMTNKKALEYVLNTYENLPVDVADKLENMLAQLEKRATAERKPSARQIENDGLMVKILSAMESNRWYGVSEIQKEFDFLPVDISVQRVSSLMTKLLEAGKVEKEVVKRKVYFKVKN